MEVAYTAICRTRLASHLGKEGPLAACPGSRTLRQAQGRLSRTHICGVRQRTADPSTSLEMTNLSFLAWVWRFFLGLNLAHAVPWLEEPGVFPLLSRLVCRYRHRTAIANRAHRSR